MIFKCTDGKHRAGRFFCKTKSLKWILIIYSISYVLECLSNKNEYGPERTAYQKGCFQRCSAAQGKTEDFSTARLRLISPKYFRVEVQAQGQDDLDWLKLSCLHEHFLSHLTSSSPSFCSSGKANRGYRWSWPGQIHMMPLLAACQDTKSWNRTVEKKKKKKKKQTLSRGWRIFDS